MNWITMIVDAPTVESDTAVDWPAFEHLADAEHERFSSATPWPHVTIDGILTPAAARRAARAFPPVDRRQSRGALWFGARKHDAAIDRQDDAFSEIFAKLQSPRFIAYVERVSGISGLRADETLFGAGLHQGTRGSLLRLHADHNGHPANIGYRRVTIMIYLNETWQPQWNGALKLWDRDALACRKRIEPSFNRCLMMIVDDTAYHEYGPLRLSATQSRNALAVYYYADAPAAGQAHDPHITLWPAVRGENAVVPLVHRLRRWAHGHYTRTFPPKS